MMHDIRRAKRISATRGMFGGALVLGLATLVASCATSGVNGGSQDDSSGLVDYEKPTPQSLADNSTLTLGTPGDLSIFVPQKHTSNISIDYTTWSEMLRVMIFYMGPSTRTIPSSVRPDTGTRLIFGHTSSLRLEGNRIFYSALEKDFLLALTEYREDLVATANRYDISKLSRNEQLGYWLNLYNVLTIEQIGRYYPVKYPYRIRIKAGPEKLPLEEAKLITIRGVPLSLKDIRTGIVYPNWKSPKTIYGFFRGEIGGPTIQGSAFTAYNVNAQLDRNAREYVNSLRGVRGNERTLFVSRIYEEARPFYFPRWPADFTNHLTDYLDDDVRASLNLRGDIRFQPYERQIADLAGGDLSSSIASTQVVDAASGRRTNQRSSGLPPQIRRLLGEVEAKRERLRRLGKIRGRVIITDVDTDEVPPEDEEVQ